MTFFIDLTLLFIALGLLVPIAVLFVECATALLPASDRTTDDSKESPPRIAILMPAHNEALTIGTTLAKLVPQLAAPKQLVAIADNCSDDTAAIAREYGVTVIERFDSDRRGKGYALDYGLQSLDANPPEVVVMVDADCLVEPGTIDRIARLSYQQQRPVQALYLMERPANPSPKDSVSALAFMVKNLVRPSGLNRLGLPCLLTGTGMAFPWKTIRNSPLASGNIVEDMQLGLDLAIAGDAPIFCGDAKVIGCLPQQDSAAKSQRTRWEHGHLQTLVTQVPRLAIAGLTKGRFDLLVLALDLFVPPLSLLVMMWVAATIGAAIAAILGFSSWLPTAAFGAEGLLIIAAILGAWSKFGRNELPLGTLLSIPLYVLWKIPLYFAFLFKPQTKWVRTERDAVNASK